MSLLRRMWSRLVASGTGAFAAAVLAGVLAIAMAADLLASDMPVVASYDGHVYVLAGLTRPAALDDKPCRTWGTDARARWSVCALVPYGAAEATPDVLRAPSLGHPLGTDGQGRDVFARLVHGLRRSLRVALLAVLAFGAIGTALGALAGFFGGTVDGLMLRLVETLSAFPTLVLLVAICAVTDAEASSTFFFALVATRWIDVARLVRAEVIWANAQDYVLAARALGASPMRVLSRHMAGALRAPVVFAILSGLAHVVLLQAALDFLRVTPGGTSVGETLGQAREHTGAWWLFVFPGGMLFVLVLALNLLAETARDLLDVRLALGPQRPEAKASHVRAFARLRDE